MITYRTLYTLSILFGFLFSNSYLLAQCPDYYRYSYSYTDEETGYTQILCTADPNQLSTSDYAKLKKATMPLTFCYDPVFFQNLDGSIMCDGENPITAIAAALNNVVSALNQYICWPDADKFSLGTAEGCEQGDAMIIPEPRSDGEFHDANNPDGIYYRAGSGRSVFPNVPPTAYAPASLYLNFTDEFRKGHPQGTYPPNCWSENCNGALYIADNQTYRCMDLETILMHEIGHILGLHHANGSKSNPGYDSEGNPCNTVQSMYPDSLVDETMHSEYSSTNIGNRSYVSCYLRCALRQLYCPQHTSHGKISADDGSCGGPNSLPYIASSPYAPTIRLFPLPSTSQLNIGIFSNPRIISVTVFSELGVLVDSREIVMHATRMDISIDISKYSNGAYYVSVNNGEGISTARFIVTK